MSYTPKKSIWKCPTCKSSYTTCDEAIKCRNNHYPTQQDWWFCKCGYGIRLDGASENSIKVNAESHLEVCRYKICTI